jgi:hypothetical protein
MADPPTEPPPGDELEDGTPEGVEADVGGDEDRAAEEEGEERQARAPWHFKVIVVGSVVYLGYRAYQGISWLAHHL